MPWQTAPRLPSQHPHSEARPVHGARRPHSPYAGYGTPKSGIAVLAGVIISTALAAATGQRSSEGRKDHASLGKLPAPPNAPPAPAPPVQAGPNPCDGTVGTMPCPHALCLDTRSAAVIILMKIVINILVRAMLQSCSCP